MRIYCAGPIFTHAQRGWLRQLGERLRAAGHDAFVPAEVEEEFVETSRTPKQAERNATFRANTAKLDAAQLLLANLDGLDVDAGTAWEVGFGAARRIPILGYRFDYRSLGREGTVNLMLEHACSQLLWVPTATEAAMLDRLVEAVEDPLFAPGGKLVRHLVPEVVQKEGRRASTRKAKGDELDALLRLKVIEEAGELIAAFESEEVAQELADIVEAAHAVARHHKLEKEVERVRAERAERLGTFDKGVVLEGLDAREA
ncbi:MAG TPA: nucleoside 2-deoxyribosyltransferase [Candidatus Thermoplasmatota archaeon]|nr:nucleoside 2-deoxyribosyltransferase [Candidatus Thermoplasmatota archaeon]